MTYKVGDRVTYTGAGGGDSMPALVGQHGTVTEAGHSPRVVFDNAPIEGVPMNSGSWGCNPDNLEPEAQTEARTYDALRSGVKDLLRAMNSNQHLSGMDAKLVDLGHSQALRIYMPKESRVYLWVVEPGFVYTASDWDEPKPQFDMLLADIREPGSDGYRTLMQNLTEWSGLPVWDLAGYLKGSRTW